MTQPRTWVDMQTRSADTQVYRQMKRLFYTDTAFKNFQRIAVKIKHGQKPSVQRQLYP
jgi:hypothetical protein